MVSRVQLSPYMLQAEAHYTLEYLIRRYDIQVHSVDAVCRAMLPFHDTEVYPFSTSFSFSSSSRVVCRMECLYSSADDP